MRVHAPLHPLHVISAANETESMLCDVTKMAVRSVAFSRRADFAVSGAADGCVRVLDLPSFAVRQTFVHGHEVNCVAIAPRSGALVLSAGDDGKCKAWALGGALVSSFAPSDGGGLVYSCAIAEDETRCHLTSYVLCVPCSFEDA
ncbi:hypothetical protein BASA81_003404 [Batrachochytrium salamandrivorans]|nr:hypothetical protein BASA81_003404 [Batrachochytrium salamandrivorans]